MTTPSLSSNTIAIRWQDMIEYPQTGATSRMLLEDKNCRCTLMILAAGMQAAAHATPRNATVHMIEGTGLLIVEETEIHLEVGVFAFIPAHTRHSIKAMSNLAFLLILSEQVDDPEIFTSFAHNFPSTSMEK
jgi:quercetin dioxygenase-like cupin family protein